MSDALRYEWTRLTTLRSTYWMLGLAVLSSAAVAFLFGFFVDEGALVFQASVLTGGSTLIGLPLVGVFVAIVGIFTTGHEYRHSLIQPTLIAMPRRGAVLGAKILVALVTAVVVTLVSTAVNIGIGVVTLGDQMDLGSSDLQEIGLGYGTLVLLWTLTGLGMAQLFRGVPTALVLLFVIPMVIEPLISALALIPALDWLGDIFPYLPFTAGNSLVSVPGAFGEAQQQGGMAFEMLDRWAGGGIMAIYVVILLVVSAVLFRRRDA